MMENENKEFEYGKLLASELIKAFAEHSSTAQIFMDKVRSIKDWESIARILRKAEEIISYSFVGILGISLSRVFAIGKESPSEEKFQKYGASVLQISRLSIKLLCFTLMAKLGEIQRHRPFDMAEDLKEDLATFLNNHFELESHLYLDVLQKLIRLFTKRNLPLPIPELEALSSLLGTNSEFEQAWEELGQLEKLLEKQAFNEELCFRLEFCLSKVLSNLNFLVSYKMVSIKQTNYEESPNARPQYVLKYASLGINRKANVNQEGIITVDQPVRPGTVVLFKGKIQDGLYLFPFIVDFGVLEMEPTIILYYSKKDFDHRLIFQDLYGGIRSISPKDHNNDRQDLENQIANNFNGLFEGFKIFFNTILPGTYFTLDEIEDDFEF